MILGPFNKLEASFNHIIEPKGEVLFREIGFGFPNGGHTIELQRSTESFHRVSNVEGTSETESEIFEGILDFSKEIIHSLNFLQ